MILALMVAPLLSNVIPGMDGWRMIFIITGALGIVMAIVIFFGIREMPRGKSEPEFQGMEDFGQFKFNWASVKDVMKKKTMNRPQVAA